MFTIRNLGGIALLMAGSTWLWLTPAFASPGIPTSGFMWAATRLLSLLTVAAFCVATWALFTRRDWWEHATLGAAALGLLALVAYGITARQAGEPAGSAAWNAFVHVLMLAGVTALLLVPDLERRVDHQVMGR